MKKTLIVLMSVLLAAMLVVSCDDKKEVANYTVTFDLDGGTLDDLKDQTVVKGEYATNPGSPTKDTYTFVAWYDGDEKFDFENTKIEKNYTLTAKWGYTVTFNSVDGTEVPEQVVLEGKNATKPTNPTKSGNLFQYWRLDAKEFSFDTPITNDITLVAVWSDTVTLGKKNSVDITWKVLAVDEANNCALIISQDILVTRQFHASFSNLEDRNYATSDIRTYLLSDDFFTTYGLDKSYMVQKEDLSDVGVTDKDYVFLLSKTEAEKTAYFADDNARKAQLDGAEEEWWLRSPSGTAISAYYVTTGGATNPAGRPDYLYGLRPAFWYTWN